MTSDLSTRVVSTSNIPVQRTSFVGRVAETATLKALLVGHRYVILTGVGGCGKTRLALQVAADLATAHGQQDVSLPFPDGIWRVDLAPLADPARLPYTLAAALDVRDEADKPILTSLVNALGSKRLLLLLDNCEHLKPACADLVTRLLDSCPHIHILATSRAPLALPTERVFSLTGLAPDEAIQLFVERTARLVWGFDRTPANAPAIDHICHTLAGLPLALELAATRVSALSVQEIAARLNDTVRLLTRNASPDARHPTLEATLDWSYALLTEAGQRLLRRLAVFAGSFSLEGAAAVGEAGEGEPTLTALLELVDHSLVSVVSGDDQPTPTRYRLLEPVRQYAWDKLDAAQETDQVGRRHALYYDALARHTETELHGSQATVWHTLLDLEYDNFQAALHWAADHHEIAIELQIGLGVASNWHARGRLSQAFTVLDTALQRAGSGPPQLRGRALHHLSLLAKALGDFAKSEAIDKDLLELYRTLDDVDGMAGVLGSMAIQASWRAEVDHAVSLFQETLALAVRNNDKRHIAATLNNLGGLVLHQRAFETAKTYLAESEALFREINTIRGITTVLSTQAELAFATQDLAQADQLASQSLVLNRKYDFRTGQIHDLLTLGKVRRAQGEPRQALEHYQEAMSLCLAQSSKPEQILCLVNVAGVLVDVGMYERAAHILAATETLRASIGLGLLPLDAAAHDRNRVAIQDHLDIGALTQAQIFGRTLDWDQVGAYVLETELVRQTGSSSLGASYGPLSPPGESHLDLTTRTPASGLRFFALGPAKVYRHGYLVTDKDWTFAKPKELLFFILTHTPATKEKIGLALWPEASSHQLQGRFNDALYRLRRVLGDRERTLLIKTEGSYRLNPNLSYWYDVAVFETLVRQASSMSPSLDHLEQALALYQGDFLADFSPVEWIRTRRVELQQKYIHLLLTLGNIYLQHDRGAEASDLFQRVIHIDNLVEEAHRQLMRCYVRLGERGRAVRHYQSLSDYLYQQLDTQPDQETILLYRLITEQGSDI